MTRVALITVDFGLGGSGVADNYLTSLPNGSGNSISGSGFESSTGATCKDIWSNSAVGDTDRRPTFNQQNHYAKVEFARTGDNFSPAILARHGDGADNGYQVDPGTWAGTVELGEWSSGVYTLLASGATGIISVGDTIQIECDGTTISGGINGIGDVSTTDSTHTSGFAGIGCDANPGAAVGTNFEAGHIETNLAPTRVVQNDTPALRERRRRKQAIKKAVAAMAAED